MYRRENTTTAQLPPKTSSAPEPLPPARARLEHEGAAFSRAIGAPIKIEIPSSNISTRRGGRRRRRRRRRTRRRSLLLFVFYAPDCTLPLATCRQPERYRRRHVTGQLAATLEDGFSSPWTTLVIFLSAYFFSLTSRSYLPGSEVRHSALRNFAQLPRNAMARAVASTYCRCKQITERPSALRAALSTVASFLPVYERLDERRVSYSP